MGKYTMNFKEYLEKLESLDVSKTLLKEDRIVLVISGSSNLKTAALKSDRFEMLSIFKEFGYKVINSNFPYNEDFDYNEFEDINILKASLSNIVYYNHTLFDKRFEKEILRHLSPLKFLKDVIVISQSSGLNVWKRFMDLSSCKNENIKIYKTEKLDKEYKGQNGQIVDIINKRGPVVKVKNGALVLLEVKFQGKKLQRGADVINGRKMAIGECLK